MGDHRAPRGARRRSPSGDSAPRGGARRAAPAKRAAAPEVAPELDSAVAPVVVAPAPAVESLLTADATTAVADATTTGSLAAAVPGKRRAERRPQRSLRLLPSMPLVAGLATVAVAALGATTAVDGDTTQAAAHRIRMAPAGALSGSSATSSSDLLSSRGGGIISRSSSRDAQAASADTALVEQAEETAEQRDVALAQFAKKAENRAATIAKNAWVKPLTSYHFSARFGAASYLWSHLHTGQDLGAPIGTQIHSIANGVVTETGYDGSYGNKTVITLDDGTEIWYCHQTTIFVNVGERVTGNEIIGLVGSTGNSTGPHLHIEVRPGGGDPVDPVPAFQQHGVTL